MDTASMMSMSMISFLRIPTARLPTPFVEEPHRLIAELRRQHSVRHGGRTAALNVPDTGRDARNRSSPPASCLRKLFRAHDALRHHDDVGVLSARARTVDAHDDIVHIERDLGHDDNLRARSDTAVKARCRRSACPITSTTEMRS